MHALPASVEAAFAPLLKAEHRNSKLVAQPRSPRNLLVELFKWTVLVEKGVGEGEWRLRTTGRDVISSCVKRLEELKPIRLSEMQVPKVHEGRYLVCRALVDPIAALKTAALELLVEDLDGEVEHLSLYNFQMKFGASPVDCTPSVTVGSIFVVKEPSLKYTGAEPNAFAIRVDSPTDVLPVLETDHKTLESIAALKWHKKEHLSYEQLKVEGNNRYGQKDYTGALKLYDRALLLIGNGNRAQPQPDGAIDAALAVMTIPLNKSAALMQIGRYSEAYHWAKLAVGTMDDAAMVVGDDSLFALKQKALLRMAKAAYGMREWDKAKAHYQELLGHCPQNAEAKEGMRRVSSRIVEARTGRYDPSVHVHDDSDSGVRYDVADYTGLVKIETVPGKGMGLVATEDVKSGTLLLVSKAFVFTQVEAESDEGRVVKHLLTRDVDNDRVHKTSYCLQHVNAMHILMRNPQMTERFYSLWAGADLPRNYEAVTRIPPGVVDAWRVETICNLNSFRTNDIESALDLPNSGLWLLPSSINHSCIPSSRRVFNGDLMLVYATRDLKRGDEVTIAYCDGVYEEREMYLENGWGFRCQCPLCEQERADPNRAQRADLMKRCTQYTAAPDEEKIAGLESILKEMRRLYANSTTEQRRLALAPLLYKLASAYQSQSEHAKAAAMYTEAFECYAGDALLSGDSNKMVEILVLMAHNNTYSNRARVAKKNLRDAEKLFKEKGPSNDQQAFLRQNPLAEMLKDAWERMESMGPGFKWPPPSQMRKMRS